MINRELKKLNRIELLELLLESTARCETMQKELDRANELLADREFNMEQSGTLAEAALRLSGVFSAADEAAALYRENAERIKSETEAACAAQVEDTASRAAAIIADAEKQAATLISDAEKQSAAILENAEKQSKAIIEDAEKQAKTILEDAQQFKTASGTGFNAANVQYDEYIKFSLEDD